MLFIVYCFLVLFDSDKAEVLQGNEYKASNDELGVVKEGSKVCQTKSISHRVPVTKGSWCFLNISQLVESL